MLIKKYSIFFNCKLILTQVSCSIQQSMTTMEEGAISTKRGMIFNLQFLMKSLMITALMSYKTNSD